MCQIIKNALSCLTVFSIFAGTGMVTGSTVPTESPAAGSQIIKIPCGMVSCYLIVGDDQCILVDTGGAKNREKVYNAVKDYRVTLIVLTHGHYDHIQNAAYLAEKLDAKTAMHKDDAEFITNQSAQKADGRSLFQRLSSFFSIVFSPTIKIDPFVPDFYLSEGQSLAEYGIEGTIVTLKGHTKGSIGILLNNGKDFIVGDALMNFFKVTEPFLYENYDDLRASTKIIEDTGAAVYPGHGKCYTQN